MDTIKLPTHMTFKDLGWVLNWTTFAKSTLHAQVAAGEFPKPIRLGKRRVAWRLSDLLTWAESREVVS